MNFYATRGILGLSLFLIVACGQTDVLRVDTYHLRDIAVDQRASEELGTAEKKYLLHGKVGNSEREQQKGHYFTVRWNLENGGGGPVELRMKYRQAKTGAKVLTKQLNGLAAEGTRRININGDEYSNGGRILSWKVEVFQSGKFITSRQSYLWE